MKLKNFWKTFSVLAITFFFAITTISAPAFAIGAERTYKVTVATTCKALAGTNANVEINLINDGEGTGFISLNKAGNDFKKCSNQTYDVRAEDIGDPTAITLKIDSNGVSPNWKVDDVKIDQGTSRHRTCAFNTTIEKNSSSTKTCK